MVDENGQAPAVPEGTQTPAPQSFIGTDGTLNEGWKNLIEPEFRGEKSLDSYKTFGDVAKSLVMAQKTIGKKGVILPTDKSTPQEVEEFYNSIGRPKTSQEYKFGKDKEVPPELYDDKFITSSLDRLHKAGATQKIIDVISQIEAERIKTHLTNIQQESEKFAADSETFLMKTWGDKYKSMVHSGDIAIEKGSSGDKELKQRLIEKFGNDPDFIMFSANLGQKFGEHSMTKTPSDTADPNITDEIAKLMADPAYLDKMNPNHNNILNKLSELHKKKTAGK